MNSIMTLNGDKELTDLDFVDNFALLSHTLVNGKRRQIIFNVIMQYSKRWSELKCNSYDCWKGKGPGIKQ